MSLLQRLEALERRLDSLERQLGVAPPNPSPIEPPPLPIAHEQSTPSGPPPLPIISEPPAIPLAALLSEPPPIIAAEPIPAPEPPTEVIAAVQAESEDVSTPKGLRQAKCREMRQLFKDQNARSNPQARRPAAFPGASRPPFRLEQAIGLKWSGWIGAIVLVIGAAMGVQFAYQNHWFGHLPPAFRLAMIFAVGIALLCAGEVVLRRVHQVPAASLFGAGVAVLFLGSYAGYAYFELYTRSTSMALMGGSTLIGAAVAMRGNLVSIAVLSLIGANVTPLLVATPNAPVLPFLFYLLMMLVVALTLAAWGRGGKWWILRGLSLCPTVLWMCGVLSGSHGHDLAVLVFMILFAVLYHCELILSTVRQAPASQDPAVRVRDSLSPEGEITPAVKHAAIGTTFALCVTIAFTIGLLQYLSDASDTIRTGYTVVLSLISAVMGIALPGLHPALRRLALSHRIAAAGLLVLAVPLYTGGIRLEIGWMLMALSFAFSWRFSGSRVSRGAAPILWLLGLGKLFFTVSFAMVFPHPQPLGETWLTIWSVDIGCNVILAWWFSLSGQLIAALILRRKDQAAWIVTARILSGACGVVWISSSIPGLPPLGATGAIIAYAWILLPFDRMVPELEFATQAGVFLLIAIAKWVTVDTVAARLSPDWERKRPVFNSMTGVGALAAASLLGFHRLAGTSPPRFLTRRRDDPRAEASSWNLSIAALVIALLTISFSFEIDRVVARAMVGGWSDPLPAWQVRQLSFTILWSISVAAIALVVARLAIGPLTRDWMRAVWLLIALLTAKFILIDTLLAYFEPIGSVTPVWNLQVLAGMAIVACLACVRLFSVGIGADASKSAGWAIGLLAAFLIAYTGTLEIDRAIGRWMPPLEQYGIHWHLKHLAWTAWWTLVAGSTLLICRRLDKSPEPPALWLIVLPAVLGLIAAQHLFVDQFLWRQWHAPPDGWMVLLNWDVLVTAVVLAGVWLASLLHLPATTSTLQAYFRSLASFSTIGVLLTTGLVEVDRAFTLPSVLESMRDAKLAEQVALSIYLATFAIVTVSIGFWRRAAPLRYVGLTILAGTLLKVVFVDLSQVRYGYRILSFLGLGMILLITSVMYGKIGQQLLQQESSKPEE